MAGAAGEAVAVRGSGAGAEAEGRRSPRSPSPGRPRGQTDPRSPARGSQALPASPGTHRNAGPAAAAASPGAAPAATVEDLRDRVEGLTARVIGVETESATLQRDAKAALELVLVEARREFEAQGLSLLTLREEVTKEIRGSRHALGETRQAVELLYAGAQETRQAMELLYTGAQGELAVLRQQLADLAGRAAGGGSGGPADGGQQ